MENNLKQYELTIILLPEKEGADLDQAKAKIKKTIESHEGSIEFKKEENKDLSYPINKKHKGLFLTSIIKMSPDKISNLSKELKTNQEILRHLITEFKETPEPKEEPRPEKPKKKEQKEKPKKAPEPKEEPKPEPKPQTEEEKKEKEKELDKKLDEIIEEI
ncbi:MAG: hypothetical protein GF387_02070 [Candidatus Portnoybacteria bacterium]|nr:hypothetical protein [Candidatus Portnoybacteria bacterium]